MDGIIIALIIFLVLLFVLYKFARGLLKLIGFAFFILTIVLAIITVFVFLDISDFKKNAASKNTMILIKDDSAMAAFRFSSVDTPQGCSDEEVRRFDSLLKEADLEKIKVIDDTSYKTYLIDYYAIDPDERYSDELVSASLDEKNSIFSTLVYEKLAEEPGYLFEGYRRNEVLVYPETAMFAFIRYVPTLVFEKAGLFTTTTSKTTIKEEDGKIEYKRG